MLLNPTGRPDEPITAGLAHGPGAGPEALGMDPRVAETKQMAKKWLPILRPLANNPDTPDSVKVLYRYLASS
jgi:hypothetical protein